ncbi:hypothetical protein KBI52_05835 [Microvirga sp. HBU67558]|uniref:hypothetical protein n=1 Tax=Microvirga TaxID=186650 RepID=UPI001B36F9A2|nr:MULTISPECIES: hypothetical protein [unclassified Microvirga]MBQ0819739.1 hypothetical protein [Microvirga sp. HBU67558]
MAEEALGLEDVCEKNLCLRAGAPRLSPFDLLAYLAYLALGTAAVQEGRHDDAAAAMQRM